MNPLPAFFFETYWKQNRTGSDFVFLIWYLWPMSFSLLWILLTNSVLCLLASLPGGWYEAFWEENTATMTAVCPSWKSWIGNVRTGDSPPTADCQLSSEMTGQFPDSNMLVSKPHPLRLPLISRNDSKILFHTISFHASCRKYCHQTYPSPSPSNPIP